MSERVENSSDSETSKSDTTGKVSQTVCRRCFKTLDPGDNFCRHCGWMTEVGAAMVKIGRLPAPSSAADPEKPLSWTKAACSCCWRCLCLAHWQFGYSGEAVASRAVGRSD